MTKSTIYKMLESIKEVKNKSCADIMEVFGEQLEKLSYEELEEFEVLFYEDESLFLDANQEQRELIESVMECIERLDFE